LEWNGLAFMQSKVINPPTLRFNNILQLTNNN
jgi:hypothetical protein